MFDVLIPAGTLKTAPIEVATGWLPGELVGIEILIPDGPNGLAGVRILLAHAQAIPRTAGAWIVGNDEKIEWPTLGYPNSGAWSVSAYNSDLFDHTFTVRYLVADFVFTAPQPTAQRVPTPLAV